MFGLTFEKLLLVAVIAGVVIGPQRLPHYAHRLGELIRTVRDTLDTTRTKAEAEVGISLSTSPWEGLDVRQYDPRRIVREALTTPAPGPAPKQAAERRAALEAEAARVRPGQRYLVTGSAAHPRRVLIASLPANDPRRVAASALGTGGLGVHCVRGREDAWTSGGRSSASSSDHG